jgi:hypothetical protein
MARQIPVMSMAHTMQPMTIVQRCDHLNVTLGLGERFMDIFRASRSVGMIDPKTGDMRSDLER